MNKQNAFRRGFTLIELMIVIVILGILMGTILPRLTGAQARARDTARKADLTNISQALEVYYGDTGQYPAAGATPCLYDGGGNPANENTVYTALKGYMKGDRVPQAVSGSQNTLGCVGSYFYKPLYQGGVERASYVLASDVETWQLANYVVNSVNSAVFDSSSDANKYVGAMEPDPSVVSAADASNTQKTIFIVIP